jgi:nitrogenase molybdenum-iron protein alpha chain
MNINLNTTSVPNRETRLGSVTGCHGDLEDLVEQSKCGTLENRERCFNQSSLCLNMCGLTAFAEIRDVAVINHSSTGCCAGFSGLRVLGQQLAARINKTTRSVMIGTNLDESDTVFGALDSLHDIALEVVQNYKPRALFIGTSCVSGVIGEDIDGVVDDLNEELDIPVVALHCEGFRSKIWQSGADIADQALLRSIIKPPKEKRQVVNFKNFFESERPQITEIFAELGVTPQFLYFNSTIDEIEHLSESLATISICGTLGTYLGNGLEELYGVPYIRSLNPSGIAGFEAWLREIGRVIGKSPEVEAYLDRERAKYLPEIEAIKKELEGYTAVIGMGPGYTFEVSRVLQEFGIKIVWALAWHLDRQYDDGELPPSIEYLHEHSPENITTSVADQQNFELMHILNTYKPDLYFSRHPGTTVWAVKMGIASVYVADEYMIFGYKGTLNFAKSVLDSIRNRSFEKNLAARTSLPYTDWWYRQEYQAMMTPTRPKAPKAEEDTAKRETA